MRKTALPAVVLLAALWSSALAASPTSKTWTLHHAVFDDEHAPVFVPRGRIRLSLDDNNELKATLEHEAEVLDRDLAESLRNDRAWYQLKLVSDDDTKSEPILTTVPACQVRRANFR